MFVQNEKTSTQALPSQFYFQSEFEWGGDGPQGAGHTGAPDDTYSSGAYSPDFPVRELPWRQFVFPALLIRLRRSRACLG